MLNEEPDGISDTARGHVGGVAQEDGAVVLPAGEPVEAMLKSFLLQVFRQRHFSFRDLKDLSPHHELKCLEDLFNSRLPKNSDKLEDKKQWLV